MVEERVEPTKEAAPVLRKQSQHLIHWWLTRGGDRSWCLEEEKEVGPLNVAEGNSN